MSIFITGVAGFIGFHVAKSLLDRGETVIGLDNLNEYYDIRLKKARLSCLENYNNFEFIQADVCDWDAMKAAFQSKPTIRKVVHLAASAGIRYSRDYPLEVINDNIVGHAIILELCRYSDGFEHLVYASSSSVYSEGERAPYAVDSRTDRPVSIYAATKAADELLSQVYSNNFKLPQTALRYFTVYGPWGRPDMAYYIFTDAIANSRPIKVFNFGNMRRDFVYIDDVVVANTLALDNPPEDNCADEIQIFNVGCGYSESLGQLIALIENNLGMKAIQQLESGPGGEMLDTVADMELTKKALGFEAKTTLEEGIGKFVDWYKTEVWRL